MPSLRPAFVSVALTITSVGAIAQTTLQVPLAFPSIQGAIAAATPGDTVLVAPGTYLETIDFLGKAITVRSSNGAAVTTIDGNQAGSVVTFATSESRSSVLDGFTITNGRGAIGAPLGGAGGIQCRNASPTIRRCIITGNFGGDGVAASQTGNAGGPGGVLATGTALLLADCVISANIGGTGGAAAGSSPFGVVGGSGGPGGAQFSFDSPALGFPDIQRCRFTGNTGGNGGPATGTAGNTAVAGSGGPGGVSSYSTISLTLFVNLQIDANQGGHGGVASSTGLANPGRGGNGGFAFASPTSFSVAYLGLLSSAAFDNTGGNGGAGANSAGGHGGGSTGALRFHAVSSTIAGNVAGVPQVRGSVCGGLEVGGWMISSATLSSSILWGNIANGLASDLVVSGIVASANGNDIGASTGTVLGAGNISTDPLFVNLAGGDVHLTAASPCRHTGITGLGATTFDYEGDPRVVGPATDMGADEFDALIGSREDFALSVSVNGSFAPGVQTSTASAGDLLAIVTTTPAGTLDTEVAWLAFEVWVPPVAPVGPPALPELWVAVPLNLLAVYPTGVGATGTNVSLTVPPGLGGLAVRFQSFCFSPFARNGVFAATSARDVVF